MADPEIGEIRRVFTTRLDALSHILDVGERHFGDLQQVMGERLAPDMFPFGTQIAFACNQPRGFAQWCAGKPVQNLSHEVESVDMARAHISATKEMVAAVAADDGKLDEIKRVGLGPGAYCELPARLYVSDYLLPNLYFHITTAYAILRKLGAPLGKGDYLPFLAPHVKSEQGS